MYPPAPLICDKNKKIQRQKNAGTSSRQLKLLCDAIDNITLFISNLPVSYSHYCAGFRADLAIQIALDFTLILGVSQVQLDSAIETI